MSLYEPTATDLARVGGAAIGSTNPVPTGGNVAHDAADAGNPVKIGGKAESTTPADVADGDRVDAFFDLKGRQVVKLDTELPAGTQNIGDVDVASLPSIPTGANTIGAVNLAEYTPSSGRLPVELDAAALAALETIQVGSIAAGDTNIGNVDIASAIPTGDNVVGRVKLTDGTLVASLRDTGGSDSLNVAIVDGSGNQITSFGSTTTPSSPTIAVVTSGSVAANGGTEDIDSAESAAKKLSKVIVAGPARFKATLKRVDNSVATTVAVGYGGPDNVWEFTPPHPDYVALGTTAGSDLFRISIVNLDVLEARVFDVTYAMES